MYYSHADNVNGMVCLNRPALQIAMQLKYASPSTASSAGDGTTTLDSVVYQDTLQYSVGSSMCIKVCIPCMMMPFVVSLYQAL